MVRLDYGGVRHFPRDNAPDIIGKFLFESFHSRDSSSSEAFRMRGREIGRETSDVISDERYGRFRKNFRLLRSQRGCPGKFTLQIDGSVGDTTLLH